MEDVFYCLSVTTQSAPCAHVNSVLSLKGDVLTNVANLQTYGAVVVYVKYPENLLEVLLRTPVGHDIQNNHEFPEVYMTVLRGDPITRLYSLSCIQIVLIGYLRRLQ